MKQSIKLTFFVLVLLTFAVVPALPQAANEAAKKRAEELLVKAREAIGGGGKIKAVKSLSLTGKFLRSSSGGEKKGEVEFNFLFPDKYIKRVLTFERGETSTMISALDGETAWHSAVSSDENIIFEGFTQKAADERKPALRSEAARWIVGLLLRTPNWSLIELTYASEANADGKRADLIDVKGADGFQARLFLDKTTRRLAMVSYTGKLPGIVSKMINIDDNGVTSESVSGLPESVAGMKADEVRVRFSDYRAIDGIQMPHRVVFQSGEGIKEEWDFTKIRLHAPLAPESFKKKA